MSSTNTQTDESATSRPSKLGKASLVLGKIALAMIILFPSSHRIVFAMMDAGMEGSMGWSVAFCLGFVPFCGFFLAPVVGLVGSCLAAAALWRNNRRRGASVAGLVLNLVSLLAFVLVLLWFDSMMGGLLAG